MHKLVVAVSLCFLLTSIAHADPSDLLYASGDVFIAAARECSGLNGSLGKAQRSGRNVVFDCTSPVAGSVLRIMNFALMFRGRKLFSVAVYNKTYKQLVTEFGEPVRSTINPRGVLVFQFLNDKLEVLYSEEANVRLTTYFRPMIRDYGRDPDVSRL